MRTAQNQVTPWKVSTGQNFLHWSLHSWKSNWFWKKIYGDMKLDKLKRVRY